MLASRNLNWHSLQQRLGSRATTLNGLYSALSCPAHSFSSTAAPRVYSDLPVNPRTYVKGEYDTESKKTPYTYAAGRDFGKRETYMKVIKQVGVKDPVDFASVARNEVKKITNQATLSQRILHYVKGHNYELAYELVKAAPTELNPAASWNVLIGWKMDRKEIDEAFKLYHDMKKRAILPNAQTFTVLFTGLGRNAERPDAVSRAVALYESMFNDNSPMQPNIIHTNAFLTVCMRAGAADDMWPILEKLPDEGPNSPDAATYTIILQCLRTSILVPTIKDRVKHRQERKQNKKLLLDKREEVVDMGLRVWAGVLSRFKRGKLQIDDSLVSAISALLCLSTRKEIAQQVLSLLDGFYGIARIDSYKSKGPDGGRMKSVMPDKEDLPEFEKLPLSNRMIGLAIESLRNAGSTVIKKYWNLFTKTLRIEPDQESYLSYMRCFAQHRKFDYVLTILEEMVKKPDYIPNAKIFYIAMSSCGGGSAKTDSSIVAKRLLELWPEHRPRNRFEQDPKLLHIYLSSARDFAKKGQLREAIKVFDQHFPIENNELLIALPSVKLRAKVYYEELRVNLELLKIEIFDSIKKLLAKSKEQWQAGERDEMNQYRYKIISAITNAINKAEGIEVQKEEKNVEGEGMEQESVEGDGTPKRMRKLKPNAGEALLKRRLTPKVVLKV